MKIMPIRNSREHKNALKRIEELWDAKPGSDEDNELEVLITLANAYEDAHYPIEPPDPVSAIEFRLEQMGEDRSALIGVIGSSGRVSEVLNGKRGLTLRMIRKLHESFDIPLESLIGTSKPA